MRLGVDNEKHAIMFIRIRESSSLSFLTFLKQSLTGSRNQLKYKITLPQIKMKYIKPSTTLFFYENLKAPLTPKSPPELTLPPLTYQNVPEGTSASAEKHCINTHRRTYNFNCNKAE